MQFVQEVETWQIVNFPDSAGPRYLEELWRCIALQPYCAVLAGSTTM
jgi:hypothetical protein